MSEVDVLGEQLAARIAALNKESVLAERHDDRIEPLTRRSRSPSRRQRRGGETAESGKGGAWGLSSAECGQTRLSCAVMVVRVPVSAALWAASMRASVAAASSTVTRGAVSPRTTEMK